MCDFVEITEDNVEAEHLCCAIADKKHQAGVCAKKQWLRERIPEGHVFRKLDAKGKVFIEYAPLEKAWVPVEGDGFLFVYCLWVAGSYKGKGYGNALLEHCIDDARGQGRSGVCVISSKKKKPFLSDRKFFQKYGFETVDTVGDGYELLALSFDGSRPRFTDSARRMAIDSEELTVYYSPQCPYISDCISQMGEYCDARGVPVTMVPVDTLEKAKNVPCVFNSWAVFNKGKYVSNHLLNANLLDKMLSEKDRL